MFSIHYIISNKKSECDDEKLRQEIDNDELFDPLLKIKETLQLDLDIQNFDNQCFIANHILNKHSQFLRLYELKDKFRYLMIKNTNKNNILREFSSCIIEKFNGFQIVVVEQEKKIRKKFRPVDIIYKPVKKTDELINCSFSENLDLSFCGKFAEGYDTKSRYCSAWQCYFCSNF